MKRILSIFILLITPLLILTGCGESNEQEPSNPTSQDKIIIAYPDGAEAIAITTLAKIIFEENGYDNIESTYLEVGLLWASLARGHVDLYLDAWLPNTQRHYWERYGDDLETLGILNPEGVTGLVVPAYVEVNSILELNDHVDLFDGKIYGLGAGSGTNTKTNELIEAYGLNYIQLNTSEATMLAELRRAINNHEAVIITGWKPHYKWNVYDLKLLDDPKRIFPIENMEIIARNNFSHDHPEIAHFLTQFKLTTDELNELIALIAENSRDPRIGAMQFYKRYKEHFDHWFN